VLTETTDMPSFDDPSQAIRAQLAHYFDGLYHSDINQLGQVFHPQAIYACAVGGTLLHYTMDQYFSVVSQRPSPASRGEPRHDEIVCITVLGPTTAYSRVRCAIAPKQFEDILSWIYLDGRWQIISKVFDYHVSSACLRVNLHAKYPTKKAHHAPFLLNHRCP